MPARNKPPSNELHLSRLYDAPVRAVWDAWIEPDQVAQWWGPRGFTITTHSKDVRTGGHWRYTMHGPDGVDYPNTTKYLEVDPRARLVYDHGGHDDRPALFRVTVTFKDVRGKTQMDMTMALATPEAAAEAKKFIKKASGESTWDRLAEYLGKSSSGKDAFVINRAFDAPIARVYEMWTNPDHFARWLPPTGAEMRFARASITVGDSAVFVMTGAFGTMHGRLDYLALDAPHLIVYRQGFADAAGAPARHPMVPTWPMSMLTTVTLTEEAPDRTRVTVTWLPEEPLTPEELATFIAERAGMTGGWTGSFDKLEELLALSHAA